MMDNIGTTVETTSSDWPSRPLSFHDHIKTLRQRSQQQQQRITKKRHQRNSVYNILLLLNSWMEGTSVEQDTESWQPLPVLDLDRLESERHDTPIGRRLSSCHDTKSNNGTSQNPRDPATSSTKQHKTKQNKEEKFLILLFILLSKRIRDQLTTTHEAPENKIFFFLFL
jgi:hypothetical protein